MQKEVNMKGEHLVVGSLEVLEEMSGAGVQAIRKGVQSAQDLIVKVSSRAEKFYKDAASDNIITPEEKKTLRRDFIEIQRTYSAILYQAEIKGLSDDPRITGLTDAYDDLYGYLYTTIRVFEDMSANTVISSSEDMNEYYDTYFDAEMFAQAVLTQTALAYVRVLSSLDDPGLSNELGYYKGQLYRYVVNEGWQAVSSGDYMGVVSSASALAEKGDVPDGSFFLCGASFIVAEYRLTTSEGVMSTDGGNHFALTVRSDAGDVWALEGGVWRRVPDRNDWRYILATNDLVALGFPISPSLEGEIRSVAQDAALELTPGKYLGPRTADPVSPALGEYYLYIGNTTLTRKNGALYKYMRTSGGTAAWTELSSLDPANYQNYMAALSDMLAEDEQSLDTGRFSVVFARTLASMSAMIETLMTQTLIIKTNGLIRSEIFNEYTGFQLNADGRFECVNGKFNGNIDSGPLYLEKVSPGQITITGNIDSYIQVFFDTLAEYGLIESVINFPVIYGNESYNPAEFRKVSTSESNTYNYVYRWDRNFPHPATGKMSLEDVTYLVKETEFVEYYLNNILIGKDFKRTAEYISSELVYDYPSTITPMIPTGTMKGKFVQNCLLVLNSEAWSMILRNIPNGYSSDYPSGTIYRDGDVLHIKI